MVRAGQERALFILAAILLFQVLKRTLTSQFAAFLSYAALMWALHGYQENGLQHLVHITAACLIAEWLSRFPDAVAKALIYIGLFQAVFGLAQYFGWNPFHYANPWEWHKPSGAFGQETLLGAFLAASLAPAVFLRKWHAAVPIFLCAMATQSSMTVLSVAAVLGMFGIAEYGIKSISAIFISLCITFMLFLRVYPDSQWGNFNGRWLFWEWAWKRFLERPLFGFGPGSWLPNAPVFEARLTHAHNEFLEFLTEYGSIGGAIAGWASFDFLKGYRPTWHHALCVGLLVNGFGSFPFHIASLGTIFLTAWLLSVRGRASMVLFRN